jgi:hypothetical protein
MLEIGDEFAAPSLNRIETFSYRSPSGSRIKGTKIPF